MCFWARVNEFLDETLFFVHNKILLKYMNNLTAKEFSQWRREKREYVYLDVRNKNEWDEGHFEESINLPLHLLPLFIEETIPDKETCIVIACAHGGRSALGAQKLLALGYHNVYNLSCGYIGYQEAEG